MKFIILLSIITFITIAAGDQVDEEEKFPRCWEQTRNMSRETERCMDSYGGTPFDILNALKPIVLQYTSTDTDFSELDEFLEINCPRIPKVTECLYRNYEVKSECPPPDSKKIEKTKIEKLVLTKIESASQYVCANNGEVIKNLIPNDGVKFIISNDDFNNCLQDVFPIWNTEELCLAIDTRAECLSRIGANHPSTYLKVVGQHFLDEWKASVEC